MAVTVWSTMPILRAEHAERGRRGCPSTPARPRPVAGRAEPAPREAAAGRAPTPSTRATTRSRASRQRAQPPSWPSCWCPGVFEGRIGGEEPLDRTDTSHAVHPPEPGRPVEADEDQHDLAERRVVGLEVPPGEDHQQRDEAADDRSPCSAWPTGAVRGRPRSGDGCRPRRTPPPRGSPRTSRTWRPPAVDVSRSAVTTRSPIGWSRSSARSSSTESSGSRCRRRAIAAPRAGSAAERSPPWRRGPPRRLGPFRSRREASPPTRRSLRSACRPSAAASLLECQRRPTPRRRRRHGGHRPAGEDQRHQGTPLQQRSGATARLVH